MNIKLGVIFGGVSVEHEVSVISAVQAMQAIDKEKYDVIPIYITKDRQWYTGEILKDMDTYTDMDLLKRYTSNVSLINKKGKFYLQSKGLIKKIVTELDLILPIGHGTNMEDGTLQGYLQTVGIPYCESDVAASSVAQDKVTQKLVFQSKGLPMTAFTWFYDVDYSESQDEILKECAKIKYPLIVKPATLGSSVGINFAKDETELKSAIEEAISYDKKILVEHAVENLSEVNISVLGDYKYQEVSCIEEVTTVHHLLTYADKYIGGAKGKLKGGMKSSKGMASTSRVIPARIDKKLSSDVTDLSKKVFKALNLSGVCRIDFLIDKKANKVYINEPNTIPGSLAFYLWEPVGKGYKTLINDMINIAIKDYKLKEKKTYSFDTNILSNYNGLKGAKGKLKR